MEWPAQSPDLNPINIFGTILALNPPQGRCMSCLLCVWSSLPYSGVRQLNKQHEIDAANAKNILSINHTQKKVWIDEIPPIGEQEKLPIPVLLTDYAGFTKKATGKLFRPTELYAKAYYKISTEMCGG
ncbi:hypothetical protein TNCV_4290281 [Trichonephila clavipes]|nr:hypothetical protein TNCV_4290281 [Trichonephila clavipes]